MSHTISVSGSFLAFTDPCQVVADLTDKSRDDVTGTALAGVTFAVKDNVHVGGMKNTAGTQALQNFTPLRDAPIVAALRGAGAVLVGKCNMHELSFGITSNNAFTGAVENYFAPGHIAGGSSGGCAVAVAHGTVTFAIGTDTGGSVRIPAALNGVVGFRPTTGRYNGHAITPLSRTRDTPGVIARTVDDVIRVDAVLSGRDVSAAKGCPKVKVGVWRDLFYDGAEQRVVKAVDAAVAALERSGLFAEVVDVSQIEGAAVVRDYRAKTSFPIVMHEAKEDLTAYLAEFVPEVSLSELVDKCMSPDVKQTMQHAVLGADHSEAYAAAMKVLPDFRQFIADVFVRCGISILVYPTTKLVASQIEGNDETVELNGIRVPTFPTFIDNTDMSSIVGLPSVTLPVGPVGPSGPGIGLELCGPAGTDTDVLRVARVAQAVLNQHRAAI
jgi:Asp-tRNA(Asn)/Glu-tRNA(Gln) amidotransferase A subunit family amidase